MSDEELCKALRSALWGQGHHINIKAADRIEALTEQLEAARADAKEVEDYAEKLEAKMGAIEQELLRRVKLAEEFKNAKGSGTSQRREHYRMHALSEALGAVRSIMKGKARTTLAEIEGEKG